MTAPAPAHWLRTNDTVWTPPAVIFADTETAWRTDDAGELHTLRCWVAHYRDRRAVKSRTLRDEWGQGSTRASLAEWIDTVTTGREAVWLWFHNTAFDLAVTALPAQLLARGWTIKRAALTGRAPWFVFAHGRRRLTITDSWTWLRADLETIGRAAGVTKPPVPANKATAEQWLARCRADVEILEAAVTQLLGWWDERQLGRWQITGSGCGWTSMRHRMTAKAVVIVPDEARLKFERLTVRGGRRQTWRIGDHKVGPFLELDFAGAYPSVLAAQAVPCRPSAPFSRLDVDDPRLDSDRWGVIAWCHLKADRPRYPLRDRRQQWYPTGEWWTPLAGPELLEARDRGELVEIGAGYWHQLGTGLQEWAQWVLRVANGTDPGAPAVAALAAKSWSRSVVGRWAMRGFETVELGPAPGDGWGTEDGWDHNAGVRGTVVDVAGRRFWTSRSAEQDNAYPAITSWVESAVRVRLGRLIDAVGDGALLKADTDGALVIARRVGTKAAGGTFLAPPELDTRGRVAALLEHLRPQLAPLTLRVKAEYHSVAITGPQHLVADGQRMFAGMPRDATEIRPAVFTSLQWPGLAWQLQHGSRHGYRRPRVEQRMAGPWPTGWLRDDGRVLQPLAEIRGDRSSRIVPWLDDPRSSSRNRLAPTQHPRLDALW